MSQDLIIVQTSVPLDFDCTDLCNHLIKEKLAICIHKTPPITSYYEWKTKIEVSPEYCLQIKSKSHFFNHIETSIVRYHPYDVPEIIGIPIKFMGKLYSEWALSG